MKTMLLATVAVVGFGLTSAFAATGDASATSAYAFPDFWGQASTQQLPIATVGNHGDGTGVNAYVTHSSRGTWLVAPDQYGGGDK